MARVLLFTLLLQLTKSQNMTEEESTSYNEFLSDQKRLWKDLFDDYDPAISGIYTLEETTEWPNGTKRARPPKMQMVVTMLMLKLVDVVEVEEKVTFLFDYVSEWKDTRLQWDPSKYGSISHIYVPQSKVWLPEVSIADAHEVKFFDSDDSPNTAWVNYNGDIGYYTSTVVSVICTLDVFKFPLDSHKCGVSLMFHGYYADEYKIISGGSVVPKPLTELGNGEWRVSWIGVAEQKSNANFSDVLRFEAKFSRNPLFYITLVMIPAFLINLLSLIAIFLNMDNIPEKINVGLTNIMAMTFILIILATDLPKTKNIPLIAVYVINGLIIVMIALGIIVSVPFVRRVQKKLKGDDDEKATRFARLKKWLKIEFVLMGVFQIANLVNFIIIFIW